MQSGVSRRVVLAGAAAATLLVSPPAEGAGTEPGRQERARARLRELEDRFGGRIGAYVQDTGAGAAFGYRQGERFPLLSTFKAVAAAAVLRLARDTDPALLDKRVRWTPEDVLPASPVTSQFVDSGLLLAQVCDAAVTRSDNTAGNVLLREIGGPAGLTRYFRSLGDPVSRLDRTETELNAWEPGEIRDTTTPAAMGRTLRRLTMGTGLVPADRDRLNGWLVGNLTGAARIRAALPGWLVGDKTGRGQTYGTANDIAVAWSTRAAPLILAVYTNRHDRNGQVDDAVIAETARILRAAVAP